MTYTPLQAHKIAERKLKRQALQKNIRQAKMIAALADKTEALAALAHDNNKLTSLCRHVSGGQERPPSDGVYRAKGHKSPKGTLKHYR